MQLELACGLEQLQLDIDTQLLPVQRQPIAPPLTDVAGALRAALEMPLGFPPLRRALTPDDHIAVVVDEQLEQLPVLLLPLLEHIIGAGVHPEAITLLCAPPSTGQPWLEELPEQFQDVHVEVHNPTDRRQLAYLATTKKGRRIYLNRSAVEADQLIVLSRRGYDCLFGYSGAEGALYPAFSDEATRRAAQESVSLSVPGESPWPWRAEASEVAWLLGAPFLVQVIKGSGNEVAHIVGGVLDSSEAGRHLLDARWRVRVPEPAEVVLASIAGDPHRQGLPELTRALACAARVVQEDGRIILLTNLDMDLGASAGELDHADSAAEVIQLLERSGLIGRTSALEWASAANRAKIFLLSKLADETAESLFTIPLQQANQVQRVLQGTGTCVVLPDAHRTLAVVG